eukprot:scaffold11107_cov48-Phaeocystis_antarctica.AAC.2
MVRWFAGVVVGCERRRRDRLGDRHDDKCRKCTRRMSKVYSLYPRCTPVCTCKKRGGYPSNEMGARHPIGWTFSLIASLSAKQHHFAFAIASSSAFFDSKGAMNRTRKQNSNLQTPTSDLFLAGFSLESRQQHAFLRRGLEECLPHANDRRPHQPTLLDRPAIAPVLYVAAWSTPASVEPGHCKRMPLRRRH